ncbi:MAG TPA: NAD-dependent epimerase/dehydratase family protein [Candidatus Saccharimonadales bacterium]|nr:NAD-dependent epimerase/dehydratase family protein [Candidatus Saccharimonadales bacterium]
MQILITGTNGFVGHHLVHELYKNGHKVIGIGGPQFADGNSRELADYLVCDLTDEAQVSAIDFKGVEAIIHLAALASVQLSFDQPAHFITTNGSIGVNLFEALLRQGVHPRLVVVSSSDVYAHDQTLPISENGICAATSPYVISKLLTEDICEYYRTRGIDCIVARPFNHIGPGQRPGFLLPDLAQLVHDAVKDKKELLVGNLKSKRDYTDVRDVVKAYRLLATAPKLGHTVYNICSGKSVAGEYFLDKLIQLMANDFKPAIKPDPKRIRPNDVPDRFGSAKRLLRETGWKPTIPLDQTIADFVSNWQR